MVWQIGRFHTLVIKTCEIMLGHSRSAFITATTKLFSFTNRINTEKLNGGRFWNGSNGF